MAATLSSSSSLPSETHANDQRRQREEENRVMKNELLYLLANEVPTQWNAIRDDLQVP